MRSSKRTTIEQTLKGEVPLSQVLAALGIEHIVAQLPQAKGRVEWLFGTFQDRLVRYLRTMHAATCEKANQLLPLYLEHHNA